MNVTNAKKALKSYCKFKGYEKPIYTLVSKDPVRLNGEIYRKKFYIYSVKVNGQHLANGEGISKRIARRKAAMFGLQNLRLMEISNLFEMFNGFVPIHRAIDQGETGSSGKRSAIEIEELIEKFANQPQLQFSYKGESKIGRPTDAKIYINNNNQDELIIAAIAKLRSNNPSGGASNRYEDPRLIRKQEQMKLIANEINDLRQNSKRLEIEDVVTESSLNSDKIYANILYIDEPQTSQKSDSQPSPLPSSTSTSTSTSFSSRHLNGTKSIKTKTIDMKTQEKKIVGKNSDN
ncbi:hypothetical protein QR98_0078390 [Sarcoptes scabiei]|uniref:Uncharacterized protein n=1 Tax=Sarcoptes scabiei TaxID=52283 RepID=A0A132AFG6_SARSC|nr:hypothetical protein QR98_0078390 [Sarcoptes scabiei]